jgi:hypothetical protein
LKLHPFDIGCKNAGERHHTKAYYIAEFVRSNTDLMLPISVSLPSLRVLLTVVDTATRVAPKVMPPISFLTDMSV